MVLGLIGCSYVLGPAVSERHALPTRLPGTAKNHVALQFQTPPYVDVHGRLPDR